MNYLTVLHDTYSSFFFSNSIYLRKISSRFLLWFFWFNIMMLITLYQATLTRKLSILGREETYNFSQSLVDGSVFGVLHDTIEDLAILFPGNYKAYEGDNVDNEVRRMLADL